MPEESQTIKCDEPEVPEKCELLSILTARAKDPAIMKLVSPEREKDTVNIPEFKIYGCEAGVDMPITVKISNKSEKDWPA